MSSKRFILAACLLPPVLVFFILCVSANTAVCLAEGPTYRVGAILPLTGDGASWGIATKDGMEIALLNLPQSVRDRIEIEYEDDAMQGKNSISAFRRLTSSGPLDVVINVTSGTGNALAPLAEKAGATFFSIASDGRISAGRPRVFMFYLNPDDEMRAVLAEMERRKYRNIAAVVAIQDGYLAGFDSLQRFQGDKIRTIFSEQFPPDVKDFRSTITKIRALSAAPDSILILLMPGQVGPFARQARELGLETPLVGGINFENEAEIESSNGALLGQWFVTNGEPTGDFLREYRKRRPDAPLASATNGHDAIAMIAKAAEANIEPKNLPDYLRAIKTFNGASGELRMGQDGQFSFPTSVKVVSAEQ